MGGPALGGEGRLFDLCASGTRGDSGRLWCRLGLDRDGKHVGEVHDLCDYRGGIGSSVGLCRDSESLPGDVFLLGRLCHGYLSRASWGAGRDHRSTGVEITCLSLCGLSLSSGRSA